MVLRISLRKTLLKCFNRVTLIAIKLRYAGVYLSGGAGAYAPNILAAPLAKKVRGAGAPNFLDSFYFEIPKILIIVPIFIKITIILKLF